MNNYKISVLKDSGPTLVGVKKDLVRHKYHTREHIICRNFGINRERFDLAWVRIRSPCLSTRTKCAVSTKPCTYRITGNVKGVCECNNDVIEKCKSQNDCTDCPTNDATHQQSAKLQMEKEKDLSWTYRREQPTTYTKNINTNNNQQLPTSLQTGNGAITSTEKESTHITFATLQKSEKSIFKYFQALNRPEKSAKTVKWHI